MSACFWAPLGVRVFGPRRVEQLGSRSQNRWDEGFAVRPAFGSFGLPPRQRPVPFSGCLGGRGTRRGHAAAAGGLSRLHRRVVLAGTRGNRTANAGPPPLCKNLCVDRRVSDGLSHLQLHGPDAAKDLVRLTMQGRRAAARSENAVEISGPHFGRGFGTVLRSGSK